MEQRQSGRDDSVETELLRHLEDVRKRREELLADALGAVVDAGRYALPSEPCLEVLRDFYFDALRLLPSWCAAVFQRLTDGDLEYLYGALPVLSDRVQPRDHVSFGLKRWADDPSRVDLSGQERRRLRRIRERLLGMSNEEWTALGWMMRERMANDGTITFGQLRHRVSEEIRATNCYPTSRRTSRRRVNNV